MRWRSTTAAAAAAAVLAACVGCAPPKADDPVDPDASSVRVQEGSDAQVSAADGALVVDVPGQSIAGSGTLSITPAVSASGAAGWAVELTGAQLVGPAELRFDAPAQVEGTPAPLIGYTQADGQDLLPAQGVTYDGKTAVVTTDHFSNWFMLRWDDLLRDARAQMDRWYSADAAGQQPRCDGEDDIRAAGYSATSDSGSQVMWCLGTSAGGGAEVKVANARGYAVAMEYTPGLTIAGTSADGVVESLAGLVREHPSLPQNQVEPASAGQELTFTVADSAARAGVRVQPSVGAYLVSAGQYAFDTLAQIAGFAGKSNATRAVLLKALNLEVCFAGYSSMVTAQVSTTAEAGIYFTDAVGTALGCLDEAIVAVGLSFWGTVVASGLSWLIAGIRTAMNGLGAAADTALNPNGYTILLTGPAAVQQSPVDAARTVLTGAEVCALCIVTSEVVLTAPAGGHVLTFGPDESVPEASDEVAVVLLDADQQVIWWGADDTGGPYWAYEAIGQDASGNVYIRYNPGRYDGVQVLVPGLGYGYGAAQDVAAQVDASEFGGYAPTFAQGYYDASTVDVDGDGVWEIHRELTDCFLGCEPGVGPEDLWFDGEQFVRFGDR